MKKTLASLAVVALLMGASGCANWNRYTPSGMDATAIADEIRKNMAADGITGMTVNVDKDGNVFLKGNVKTRADRQKAIDDARKVNGVRHVTTDIDIKP
jgi:osmotically-inducible protein OsmY